MKSFYLLLILFTNIFLIASRKHINQPIKTVVSKALERADTLKRFSLRTNAIWQLPDTFDTKDNIWGEFKAKYLYIDNNRNASFITNISNGNDLPDPFFTFYLRLKDKHYFYLNSRERNYNTRITLVLTATEKGNIKQCKLFYGTGDKGPVMWSFMAKPVTVLCCNNHNPKHCCKPMQQLKDTGRKYSCIWP